MNVFCLTIWLPGAEATRSLHTNSHGAYTDLKLFVEEHWDEEILDRQVDEFECSADMIEHFFELLEDDYQYEITSQPVRGPAVAEQPELGPDEVILEGVELEVTLYALKGVDIYKMSDDLPFSASHSLSLVRGVIKKLKD